MAVKEQIIIEGKSDLSQIRRDVEKTKSTVESFGGKISGALFQFNQGVAAAQTAVGALKTAFELADFAGEMDRLKKVVGEGFAAEIQAATGSTISKLDAMKGAAKLMTGELALSKDEIKLLYAAADDLGKLFGQTTISVVDELGLALKKGESEAFKKFGIAIDTTKSKTEQMKQAMEGLRKVAADPMAADEAADSFDKYRAGLQDTLDETKASIGTFVQSLIGIFAEMLRAWDDAVSDMLDIARRGEVKATKATDSQRYNAALRAGMSGRVAAYIRSGQINAGNRAGLLTDEQWNAYQRELGEVGREGAAYTRTAKQGLSARAAARDAAMGAIGSDIGNRKMPGGGKKGSRGGGAGEPWDIASDINAMMSEGTYEATRNKEWQERAHLMSLARGSLGGGSGAFERGEFEERMEAMAKANMVIKEFKDTTTAAGKAFSTFQSAFVTGVDQMVFANENFLKAFKRVIAESLRAEGLQALSKSLMLAAEALAQLVFGNAKGASVAAAASVKYAAASAVALGTAKLLGAGGGAPSGGSGGGGGAETAAGGGGGAGPGGGGRVFKPIPRKRPL
jgi:hypothetical protein